jgi:hypothetical protein
LKVHRRRPLHGSMALRWLANRTVDSWPAFYRFLARAGVFPPISTEPPHEFSVYGPGRKNEAMWRLVEAVIAKLKAAVVLDGARLMVFYVPPRFEVNDEVWMLTRQRYELGRRWQRTRVIYRLRLLCSTLGLTLIEPQAELENAERSRAPAYYSRDVHWNAVGNSIAARVLEPSIREALDCPPALAVEDGR